MLKDFEFTSESVSEGHPDKLCDQISDAILDEFLRADPDSKVAVETLATKNRVVLAGEVRAGEGIVISDDELETVVRNVINSIGCEDKGFNLQDLEVDCYIQPQSMEINQAVVKNDSSEQSENETIGAGDQGIMFGYATAECHTDQRSCEFMPAPIYYAHKIVNKLAELRHSGAIKSLRPDAKSQVTLQYENRRPVRAKKIVVSTQHEEGANLRSDIEEVIREILPEGWFPQNREDFLFNPSGSFIDGGPACDTGLTGRKIIVDTYGGAAPHGGGAFSGKDPTKVDRSAAYAARHLAKNVVAAGIAEECLIQLSYAIGVAEPQSLYVQTKGTGNLEDRDITKYLRENVDLTPAGILKRLDLRKPMYLQTAAYGHFGRAGSPDGFTWEQTDLVEGLRQTFLN